MISSAVVGEGDRREAGSVEGLWFEVETLARRRDGEWKPRGCWGGRDSRVSDFLELRTGVGVFGDFLRAICGFCEPKDDLLDEEGNLGEGQVGCHAPVTKYKVYALFVFSNILLYEKGLICWANCKNRQTVYNVNKKHQRC